MTQCCHGSLSIFGRDQKEEAIMTKTIDFRRLQRHFTAIDIEWKPIVYTKDRSRAMAAPYINSRAIMDRLDEVCGPENWRNEFAVGPDGGVLCAISIFVNGSWITKWDGASNTDIEAVKGGLTTSMRRAAVQWGIGRYLYRMPVRWEPVDGKGRFQRSPIIPPSFQPGYEGDGSPRLEPYLVVNETRKLKPTGTVG